MMRITTHITGTRGTCRDAVLMLAFCAACWLGGAPASASSLPLERTYTVAVHDTNAANSKQTPFYTSQAFQPFNVSAMFQSIDDLECPDEQFTPSMAVPVPTTTTPASQFGVSFRGARNTGGSSFVEPQASSAAFGLPQLSFQSGGGNSGGWGGASGGGDKIAGGDSSTNPSGTAPFEYDVAQASSQTDSTAITPGPSTDSNQIPHASNTDRPNTTPYPDRRSHDRGRPGHVVVPFPPAVWMGLIGLGLVMIARKVSMSGA